MERHKIYSIILLANIKRWRKKRNITQLEMAEALGMTKQNYYRIESGRQALKVDFLPTIAEKLHTNIDTLFSSANVNTKLEESEVVLMSYIRELDKSTVVKVGTLVRELRTRGIDDAQIDLMILLTRQFKNNRIA